MQYLNKFKLSISICILHKYKIAKFLFRNFDV